MQRFLLMRWIGKIVFRPTASSYHTFFIHYQPLCTLLSIISSSSDNGRAIGHQRKLSIKIRVSHMQLTISS